MQMETWDSDGHEMGIVRLSLYLVLQCASQIQMKILTTYVRS